MMHGPANIEYREPHDHVSLDVIYVWFGASLKDLQGRMAWLLDADVVTYSEERPRMRKNHRKPYSTQSVYPDNV